MIHRAAMTEEPECSKLRFEVPQHKASVDGRGNELLHRRTGSKSYGCDRFLVSAKKHDKVRYSEVNEISSIQACGGDGGLFSQDFVLAILKTSH